MPREDYTYISFPNIQIKVIDEILKNQGLRYGQTERTHFVRAIIGDFIEHYDKYGKSLLDARKYFRGENKK
jgi:hypothetical protein